MKIKILTSQFFQKVAEKDGYDRIIFGGAERYLAELCKWLKSLGHTVTVYQGYQGDKYLEKEYQGIPIMCIPISDNWQYTTCPELNTSFYELSLDADLRIYFAHFLAYPMVKSPCITINHGIFWDFAGGDLSRMTKEQKDEFFRRQIQGMTAPDLCVAVDTNVRNFIASQGNGDERKIMYIPNFVDTKEFYPRTIPKNWTRKRILFPRRLVQLRGINEFMVSANDLPEYDFYLCGQSFDESLEGRIEHLKDNVFTLHYPMDKMAPMYKSVDIAVIPTRASEGTSLSCIEAMASGLPVITTVAGGLSDLVIDKWNGELLDLNHDSLTEAIRRLAEDEELCRKYSQRNLQMAEECFSIDIWKSRWQKALNKVL